jgi:hypothetical protein
MFKEAYVGIEYFQAQVFYYWLYRLELVNGTLVQAVEGPLQLIDKARRLTQAVR